MAGFFIPLIVITIGIAWGQALRPRVPLAPWIPNVALLLYLATLYMAATAMVDTQGEVQDRLVRMESAGTWAWWLSLGTLLVMLGVTAYGFARPAEPPAAA